MTTHSIDWSNTPAPFGMESPYDEPVMLELRRQVLRGRFLDPGRAFAPFDTEVDLRWDPLTGHTSRIVTPRELLPPSDVQGLRALAEETRPTCPFCDDRLEERTPKLPPDVEPSGRLRKGQAVLFPNLFAYSQHSVVSVYSAGLHYLPLAQMSSRLVADNLSVQVAFARAALRLDPELRWSSINANHMPPSGSSIFHPHLQGLVDSVPTTMQRLLVAAGDRVAGYLEAERRAEQRWLGSTGRATWLTSFAPLGPAEIRAFVEGAASPVELDEAAIEELGHGISTALGLYAELGQESFNLALYGAPRGADGYMLNLRMMCRTSSQAWYRSDSTYLERLHWEAAVDITPEELAERAAQLFGG
jgi:galactose-1-phosphate uridylyltransferase